MTISELIKKAHAAAAVYITALPNNPQLSEDDAVRIAYTQDFPDWRGVGFTDFKFHQYETAFGLELVRLSQPTGH